MADGEFIITVRNCVRDPSTDRPVIDCDIIAPQEFTTGRLHCACCLLWAGFDTQNKKEASEDVTPNYCVLVFSRKVSTMLLNCSGY